MPEESPSVSEIANRFEFRTFDSDLGPLHERLKSLGAHPGGVTATEEFYCPPRQRVDWNIKVRNGHLEVKHLLTTDGPLEQWAPVLKTPLPLQGEMLLSQLCRPLDLDCAPAPDEWYDFPRFRDELVAAMPELLAVGLRKERLRYQLEDVAAEFTRLEVDGQRFESVAVESLYSQRLLGVCARLDLDAVANTSYVRFLQQLYAG